MTEPDPILIWPVYVNDDGNLQCNAGPCPTHGFLGLPGRRVTLSDVIQGTRDHVAAHHPATEEKP